MSDTLVAGESGWAFDPSDATFRSNPYPRYAEIREASQPPRTPDGLRVLTRHAEVLAALRHPRLSSDPRHVDAGRPGAGPQLPLFGDGSVSLMLLADPPDHTRLRRLANKAFTPRAVEVLRPRVQELVDEMLDSVRDAGECDLMSALAEPLPVVVICELLGVPPADWDQFKPWSSAIGRVLDPDADATTFEQAVPAIMGFVGYFGQLIEERRARPRKDLLSSLIEAESHGETLTAQDLFAMVILLFIAGHETTTNLIGNGTLALMRHRAQFEALNAAPELVKAGVEELLRYDSPVQITARTATERLDLNGLTIEKGEGVVCGLAAANRDPRFCPEPDHLHLARGRPDHVAFGNGMHHCLGAPLARLEGEVVFATLARRFPEMVLVDDDPPYRDHFVLRGLAALPVSLSGR